MVSQPASDHRATSRTVFGVHATFVDRDFSEIKRTHTFYARHIDPVLVGGRPALVKGVDATLGAEMVFRFACIEPVQGERIFTLRDFDVVQVGRNRYGSTHTAVRAVASPGSAQAIGQAQSKAHGSAMASSFVNGALVEVFIGHDDHSR